MVDIRQLRYFMAIAEEGQISRAAKRLQIAQPPLSFQLKSLEKDLGVQLIERSTRKLALTDAGHALYQRAERIIELFDSMASDIQERHAGIQGMLSFGSPPSISNFYIPDRLQTFHNNYPEVRFKWREGYTFRVQEWLDANLIEFGIVRLPVHEDSYNIIPLLTEPWVAIFAPDGVSGIRHSSITMEELVDHPLVMLNRQSGIQAHDIVNKAFSAVNRHPAIICETDSIMSLFSLVERSMGAAIVPRSMLMHHEDKFDIREIADLQLTSSVGVVWPKWRRLSTPAQLFLSSFDEP